MMDTWVWLIVAVLLAIVEMATYNLVTIWFALGAVVAFVLSLLGVAVIWQLTVFVIVSALLLLITKPLVQKKLTIAKQPTNADRVVGQDGIVINVADSDDDLFRVRVLEQVWTAKTEDHKPVNVGDAITVLRISGVKLIVKLKEN